MDFSSVSAFRLALSIVEDQVSKKSNKISTDGTANDFAIRI